MVLWWKSSDFELLLEGFLSMKSPNKQDLQCLIPSVWWPGSWEDMSYENSMVLTTTALAEAVIKVCYQQHSFNILPCSISLWRFISTNHRVQCFVEPVVEKILKKKGDKDNLMKTHTYEVMHIIRWTRHTVMYKYSIQKENISYRFAYNLLSPAFLLCTSLSLEQ